MGTIVCLPTAENMAGICGHAVDCLPSHFQHRAPTGPPGMSTKCTTQYHTRRRSSECVAFVETRLVSSRRGSLKDAAVMSGCDDSKTNTTLNRGACAILVTSASPSSHRTSAASTSSGSGSRGDGGGGKRSGFRGSGGNRVTIFSLAPQIIVAAVSTASTATVNLIEGLQKTAKKKKSVPTGNVATSKENHVTTVTSSMDAEHQQLSAHEVASPPDRRVTKDDSSLPRTSPGRNGQLSKQGSLTIVRRSSTKKSQNHTDTVAGYSSSFADDETLDAVDLDTDNLPAVDTPDACDKAAVRLRCLLRQLQRGEISAELLQKNLHYAARVLEAVFIDETKERGEEAGVSSDTEQKVSCSSSTSPLHRPSGPSVAPVQQRRLRTPVWARRLADDDDELSEVQPDAVPPEVREWLASTFTRQLATTRRKSDEKPKFRSVAHAIRAGIFVDRIYRRVSNTALMQFPSDVVRVLKTLDEWSFDVFALNDAASSQPVKYLGYDLLNRYGMIHKFKVPPVTLETFLSRVEEGYCRHKNPYHNNLHAADVAQTVHYMLCQTGLMNWLTDLEIFATLVAAIIHDYEHTGTTNNFHVMSGTETALLYNDRAVLENHHISASFRVMKDDECNILQNLSREEFREFRTLVIDMVLATDMSFHFQQLKNMKNLLTLAEPSVDKSKALSLVLHCCDISHPAKRWDLHHRWTMLLLEEFFRQGDKERELGLPFSPLCDRKNTLVAESQIGFIEFIVEPSMAVCSDMLEAILGPIHSCKPNDGAQQSISEDSELSRTKNGAASSPQRSLKFKIKKPWTTCLGENKKSWKEQAARDAELRSLQQQQQQQSEEALSTEE